MTEISKIKVAIMATVIIAPIAILVIWLLAYIGCDPYMFIVAGFIIGLFGKTIIHSILSITVNNSSD